MMTLDPGVFVAVGRTMMIAGVFVAVGNVMIVPGVFVGSIWPSGAASAG